MEKGGWRFITPAEVAAQVTSGHGYRILIVDPRLQKWAGLHQGSDQSF